MAKNALAKRINRAVNIEVANRNNISRQMCLDAAMMAANDVFNMGPSRCEAFQAAFSKYISEIATMGSQDTADLEYTKDTIDRRLRQICGDKFVPWDERYRV